MTDPAGRPFSDREMSFLKSIAAEVGEEVGRALLADAAAALVRGECDGEFLFVDLPD